LKTKKGFSKCRAQETSKRLQEYGTNFFEATKGVKGAQSKHWYELQRQFDQR